MTTPLSDQHERDRVQTELDSNLCVEASAGTGKTTVLVARIVEMLRTGNARIDELAVITFTEKAAAELAARVREQLEGALESSEDGEQVEHLKRALLDLNRAHIETIHAFASSLLRERPVEAGLDPNFEVLDDLGSSLSFDEAYRRWLGEVLSKPSDEFRRAFNRGFELIRVRQLAELLHQNRDQLPLRAGSTSEASAHALLDELSPDVSELRDLIHDCNDESDRGFAQVQHVLGLFDELRRVADRPELLDRLLLQPVKISAAGNKKNWEPGSCDRQKEICLEIKQQMTEFQQELRTEALTGILPLLERFVLDYAEQRRHFGTAEFDDLLIWSRDLLRDKPEVRDYFQRRFTRVLVDEFQDTDPLQVEIVLYLTSDATNERDWHKLRPQPGRLFVVGDPKQSIYRFRRADITIYEWVKNQVLGDGLVKIKQNFRSVPGVINWVNEIFDQLIQPVDGIQPAYSELRPTRPNNHGPHLPVVLIQGRANKADAVRAEEARLLAGLIDRLVRDEHWPVNDDKVERSACWRDIAILIPSRTGIEYYEQALAERDIPYRHEGGRAFFDRQEVREFVSCLKAIDDPTDRLSLVAALRSGAFGCSDEELHRFVSGRGTLNFRQETNAAVPAVSDALATLKGLHECRGQLSLTELVSRVLDETRLVEYALTLPQGEQAAANLLKVADQARAFSGVRGGGLRSFVRWLATSSGGSSDEADAAVAEARDNVVRILTIHGAKGLEFPIVALANLNTSRQKRSPYAIPAPAEKRLALSLGPKGNEFKTIGFDDDFEREQRHEEAEQRRLLYVAVTRARDYLIVPAVTNGDKSSGMLSALLHCLAPADDGLPYMYLYDPWLISNQPRQVQPTDPVLPEEIDELEASRLSWLENHRNLIATASQGLSLTVVAELDLEYEGIDGDSEQNLQATVDKAEALDRALHRVMARVDLASGRNLDTICREISEHAEIPEDSDLLLSMAYNCLESSIVDRSVRADEVQRGVVFSTHLTNGGFVEGRIDLLFVEGGQLVLVDFRAEEISGEEIEGSFSRLRDRAAMTALALERATSILVKEVCFLFARPGLDRSFENNDDLRATAVNLLASPN